MKRRRGRRGGKREVKYREGKGNDEGKRKKREMASWIKRRGEEETVKRKGEGGGEKGETRR